MAEQHRFKFIISRSVYSKDGLLFFKDVEDYTNRQEEKASIDCARLLATKIFGYRNDFIESLPENKWMAKYGFLQDDNSIIGSDGNVVDSTEPKTKEKTSKKKK